MPRRLLAAAVAGALAVTGLAACRDQPTVAAYVGSAQLTNAQVEQMLGEFDADAPDGAGAERTELVSDFVIREVSRRVAEEHHINVPAVDPAGLANVATGMHAKLGSAAALEAGAIAAYRAVFRLGTPQAPSEAEKREIFGAMVKAKLATPDQYEQFQNGFDTPQVEAALGLRPVLRDALRRYRVTVNPRYQPVGLPVLFVNYQGQTITLLYVPTLDAPSAVVDAS
jgi:hypothetical protein